jgi:hypothetical protein
MENLMRGKAKATLALEQAILAIVEERAPITVRGVCYALFVAKLIADMSTGSTQKVSRVMTAMREEGRLDWRKVVDGSRTHIVWSVWDDPGESIKSAVAHYRRDNWQDQPLIVEVWSEKSTVQGVLAPVLNELGVNFRIMKGFGSFTVVKQAAVHSQNIVLHGQEGVALYIGDWDPSGLYMSDVDLPQRLERYGGNWRLERIAIVQSDTRGLPHFDAATKQDDARYSWFVSCYGRRCWELDAMDPNVLRDRVRAAIVSYIDADAWERAHEVEQAEIKSMQEFYDAWKYRLGG